MLSFESDYIQGAHEKILERLAETNREPLSGYGNDRYCESAKEKIRRACGCEEAELFFLTGGTQPGCNQLHAEILRGCDCGRDRTCQCP